MRLLFNSSYCQSRSRSRLDSDGFTLLEFMAVVAIVAILVAIVAPSWVRFLDTQRLIYAQNVVYQGIQEAQMKARQHHSEWQFSIRDTSGALEWSVHSSAVPVDDSNWQTITDASIQMDSETTLQLVRRSGRSRTVRFNRKGNVVSRLGRVTLSIRRFPQVKRCVYVSTILGALRQSKEQSRSRRGDFCY
ncbi:MAG: type II secretion system protein [Cyanobacteria bacterium P01_D01_bin.1]